jgi:hypothetical protein
MRTKGPASDVRRRGGYALIILLVIIGLGVLLFILQKAGVFTGRPKDPNAAGIMPWTEWNIRERNQAQPQPTSDQQPQITSLQFDGNLKLAGARDPRGEIMMYLSAGSVSGGWYGSYHKSAEKQYDISGSEFSGSFWPGKKYVDANGNEDPSKLYFLCKGNFQMQETGKQIVRVLTGEIYVRGWLDRQNMLTGSVFITSNYKDYQEFEFKGLAK